MSDSDSSSSDPAVIECTIEYLRRQCELENTQLGFNPKKLSHILLLRRKLDPETRRLDMECIIKICVERGENLDYIRTSSKSGLIDLLDVYHERYDLVSHDDSKTAITFSRIVKCFPEFACWYLVNSARNPVVSFEAMNEICFNYPKVMMTPAFAFLIPNTIDDFCLLLKKAHMLHHREYLREHLNFHRISDAEREFAAFDIITNVVTETEAAIAESHIPEKTQLKLLVQYKLIEIDDNTGLINVSEEVYRAVEIWDERVRVHDNEICLQVDIVELDPNGFDDE